MEHVEQSEKGSLQSAPRSKEVNLGEVFLELGPKIIQFNFLFKTPLY